MNKVIQQLFPTVPIEVCDIIYQYYKLPFYEEIQNPFNKYNLHYWVYRGTDNLTNGFYHHSNLFYCAPIWVSSPGDGGVDLWYRSVDDIGDYVFKEYIIYRDNLPSPLLDKLYPHQYCNNHRLHRHILKFDCRENGIEYKERTPTKILIKKLIKL
tara:strand:+ start:334 stop:798 length:465 start_codon:yes stop_codon:yes gene_type:complete